jgi:hypothetical protein
MALLEGGRHRTSVHVDADATRAEREIDHAARDRRANLDVDTRRGQTQIQRLTAALGSLRDQSVEVDVSTERGRREAQQLARELTSISRRAWRASLVVEDAGARARLRQLQAAARAAARRVELRIDAEISPAMRGIASLRTALAVLSRDVKIKPDMDVGPAVAAATALRAGMDSGRTAINRFNRSVYTITNVARVAARVGILGLVGAIGPLIGIAGVAAAAITVLGLGFGLLAAPMLASVAAMTQHKTASEALETANEQLEERTEALTEAEENLQRTEEQATRSVEQAAQARAQAAEQYRRTQIQAEESVQDARERVAEQERSLAEAQRESAAQRAAALETYRTSVEDLGRIETENAERLRQAYQVRREAEAEYARTVAENRRRIQETTEALRTSEEELVDARQEASRMVSEARVAAEERYESALEAARDAAERTEQSEQDLRDSRERSIRSLEDLRDAQRALNEEMEAEPRRRAEAALDVRESELELSQLEQEIAEARTLGDTDRAAELQIRLDRLRLQLDEERDRLNDLQGGPSPELQQAREAVEDAWRARQQALREEQESRERLRETRLEEQEARRNISIARQEGAEEIRRAQEEAASLIENAIERVIESRQALTRAQRESAVSERQAARVIAESQREIRRTLEENRLALEEGRERARQDYEALVEARRSGAAAVAEQERALAEAIEQQSRTARQARWDVMDAREALRQSAEEERLAQVQAGRDITEAQEGVREAVEDVGKAQEEVAEKAAVSASRLSRSQAALYAALTGFAASFFIAFGPAQRSLDLLAIRALELGERALPALGATALEIAQRLHGVFTELEQIWTSPRQLEFFQTILQALPDVMGGFGLALGMFATGLTAVVAAAMPQVLEFMGWLQDVAERSWSWASSARGQNALADAFALGAEWAGILRDALASISELLWTVGSSQAAQDLFRSTVEFLRYLAENPEGIQAGLWILARVGETLMFILNIPVVGDAIGFLGGLYAVLVLFGGGIAFAAVGVLWNMLKWWALFRVAARKPLIPRGFAQAFLRPFRFIGSTVPQILRGLLRGMGRILAGAPRVAMRALRGLSRFVVRPFAAAARAVWAALSRIPGFVVRALRGIPRAVMTVLRGAGRWFAPLTSAVSRIFGGRGVLMGILRWFAGRAGIGAIFGPAGMVLATLLPFADNLQRFFNNLGTRLHNFLGRLLEPIFGGTWVEKLYRGFQNTVQRFIDWTVRLEEGIGNFAKNSARAVWNWVTGMWSGLVDGVRRQVQALWEWLRGVAENAWDYLSRFWELGSPSRKMRRLGEALTQGFAEGMRRGLGDVMAASAALNRAAEAPSRRIAVQIPVSPRRSDTAHIEGNLSRTIAQAVRAMPGMDTPIEITLPVYVGGKKLDEQVIRVVNGEAREARRVRGQMSPGWAR